jgi:hypothetical protein
MGSETPQGSVTVPVPYQPSVGDTVKVVDALDPEIHDVSAFIGSVGTVVFLDYGDPEFSEDPLFAVDFGTGELPEGFWPEELQKE